MIYFGTAAQTIRCSARKPGGRCQEKKTERARSFPRSLTFIPRPHQDRLLALAQQRVRGDGEEQAEAGSRAERLRGCRTRPRGKASQDAEIPGEPAEGGGQAPAPGLPPAEASVAAGARGREVLDLRKTGGVIRHDSKKILVDTLVSYISEEMDERTTRKN